MAHSEGPWREGRSPGSIVCDDESIGGVHHREDYGGFVVAETVSRKNRPLIINAPTLLTRSELVIEKFLKRFGDTPVNQIPDLAHAIDLLKQIVDECRKETP